MHCFVCYGQLFNHKFVLAEINIKIDEIAKNALGKCIHSCYDYAG
jgi:hypothetical protein